MKKAVVLLVIIATVVFGWYQVVIHWSISTDVQQIAMILSQCMVSFLALLISVLVYLKDKY